MYVLFTEPNVYRNHNSLALSLTQARGATMKQIQNESVTSTLRRSTFRRSVPPSPSPQCSVAGPTSPLLDADWRTVAVPCPNLGFRSDALIFFPNTKNAPARVKPSSENVVTIVGTKLACERASGTVVLFCFVFFISHRFARVSRRYECSAPPRMRGVICPLRSAHAGWVLIGVCDPNDMPTSRLLLLSPLPPSVTPFFYITFSGRS